MADTYETKIKEYLPKFIYRIKEIKVSADATDTQIKKLWEAENKRFANRFIQTADLDGIKVWEKILGITPGAGDTLQDRRDACLIMWNLSIPFSERYFLDFMAGQCGEDFSYSKNSSKSEIYITVGLLSKPVTNAILSTLKLILPAHIVCKISRQFTIYGNIYSGGGSAIIDMYENTDTFKMSVDARHDISPAAGMTGTAVMSFTDTISSGYEASQHSAGAAGLSFTDSISL